MSAQAPTSAFPFWPVSRPALLRHPLPWLLLIALAPRLYGLTIHSLWFDEVVSTVWAGRPAAEIWRAGLALTEDKHPPLYYLLLHGWTGLFGPADGAVRSLGAIIGALAVLPAYGIGLRLGERRAAAIGGLLLALNPFLIWYSQEARMFMPATTFLLLGLFGVLQLAHPGSRWLAASLLIVAGFGAALYSYLFSAFMLPVAGLWVLIAWWDASGHKPQATSRKRSILAGGIGSLAAVALLFLPLARSAWLVSGDEATPGRAFAGLGRVAGRLLDVYAFGWADWPGRLETWLVVGAGLLALAGVFLPEKQKIRRSENRKIGEGEGWRMGGFAPGLYLAAWLFTPLLIGGLLLARDRTIFAETRYFIFLVPALCLAWGRALARLREWRRAAGLAGLAVALGVTMAALPALWSPENRREAWRESAAAIAAQAGPGDAILIHADYVYPAFERYFHGPQAIFFPFSDVLADPALVDEQLTGLVNAGFAAIWLVQSHTEGLDPQNLITGWFGARYPLISEFYPPGIAIRGYATRYRTPVDAADPLRPELPAVADFADLQLLACIHDSDPIAARDDLFHPPSGWIHVTTYWTAATPPQQDIYPRVRLVDEAGQIWGEALARGNDAIHIWPTSRWLPGEVVRVDYDVNLNPLTPAGRYRLVVAGPEGQSEFICGDIAIK